MEQNQEPRNKLMHIQSISIDTGTKNTQWRNDNLFNKCYWKTEYPHVKE